MFHYSLIVVSVFFITACGSSPKTNFYTLNAGTVENNSVSTKTKNLSIGLWEVSLPPLIDRSDIVTRNGQYGVNISDFHKWADGLSNTITQVISSQLSQRLGTNRISVSPWLSYIKQDYQVRVKIKNFDGELGKEVILNGVWILLSSSGQKEIIRESFYFKAKTKNKSYTEMAATFSKLTIQLSEKIANKISSEQK